MYHLLLLLARLSARCNAGNSTSTLSRIPDLLQWLCPGANVCHENQTFPAPEYTFGKGYGSCCTECSCRYDCNGNDYCCFPPKPLPNDDEELNALQKIQTCLYPVTPQPLVQDVQLYQPYRMVSSVPGKSVTNISCGEENVAPWGSLYPVYSANSKQIYKIMACAAAHGVTDGIMWDTVLNCNDFLNGIKLDASNFVLELDSNSFPNECAVDFVYPDNNKNIQHLRCCADIIKTCPDSHFLIPDEADTSEEDIIEMCTSGLVSPFRALESYANVFCNICSNTYFARDMACRQPYDETRRGPRNRGSVALLDEKFITEGRKEILRERAAFPTACGIGGDSGRCRPVLCPSGQLRDRAGVCTYPNKLWYDLYYTVYINLTTETAINLAEVFKVQQGFNMRYLPDFTSPWPENWYIYSIFTDNNVLDGGYKRASFQVILKRKLSAAQPKNIVQTVKRMAAREWFLQHKKSSFVLKSHISRYANIDFVTFDVGTSFFFGTNSRAKNKELYFNYQFEGSELSITKLYFCDQVELNHDEVIFSPNKNILFNKVTKRHLFAGEFALVLSSAYEGMRARICIEDSEMYEMVSHSGANWFSDIYCVRLIAVTLLLVGAVNG